MTPEQQAALDAVNARIAAGKAVAPIDPSDRLLPEVMNLGSGATDDQIRSILAARRRSIAEQQTQAAPGTMLAEDAKSLIREGGRSIASLPQTIVSAPWNIANLARAAVHGVTGLGDATQLPPPNPLGDLYTQSFPSNPKTPIANAVGGVLGPAIVEAYAPMLGGRTSGGAPLVVRNPAGNVVGPTALRVGRQAVVRPAMTTASTLAGQEAGKVAGQVGDYGVNKLTGGDEHYGEQFLEPAGAAVGSVAVPPAVSLAARTGHTALTDDRTLAALNDALRNRIPLSIGLVGNKWAKVLEDALAGLPFAANPVTAARRGQREAMDAAAGRIATDIRGNPYVGPGISAGSIGTQARDVAQTAQDVTRLRTNAVLNPVYEQIGRERPLDQTREMADIENQAVNAQDPTIQRARIEAELAKVDASRLDPRNQNRRIVDPQLEAQLQTQLTNEQNNLANAQAALTQATSPVQLQLARLRAQQAQANIERAQNAILANRGSTLDQVIYQRSRVGESITGQGVRDDPANIAMKNAKTRTIEDAAINAGIPPGTVEAVNRQAGDLAEQRNLLRPVAAASDTGAAYNALFGGGMKNLDIHAALGANAPDPMLNQLYGNELELRLRGPGTAGQVEPNPDTFDPRKAGANWRTLDPQLQEIYAPTGSPARLDLDAFSRTMLDETARPTRAIPQGGGSIGAGQTMYQNPAIITALSAIATGDPVKAAAAGLGSLLAPRLLAQGFVNPNVVRAIATPPRYLPPSELTRLLVGAVQ